jgi:hypothetical protein
MGHVVNFVAAMLRSQPGVFLNKFKCYFILLCKFYNKVNALNYLTLLP